MDACPGESSAKDIANFYCELAATEITHGRWDPARGFLDEALAVNRECARANILLGDIEMADGNVATAIEYWKADRSAEPGLHCTGRGKDARCAHAAWAVKTEGLIAARLPRQLSFAGPAERRVPGRARIARAPRPRIALVRDELRRKPTLLGLDKLARSADAARRRRSGNADLELVIK